MVKHIVVSDLHATPYASNARADWLGELILEERPDVVIVNGDMADMPSLSTYDKGKKSFQGRTYKADIEAHLDFQHRMWAPYRRAKKRYPKRICTIGNHEQRIERAIEIQPELEGTISYDDLKLEKYYDIVVPYDGATPGQIEVDGIIYAHYLVTGVSGRPVGGERHASSLLSKLHTSCVVGHSHLLDYCVRTTASGKKIMGLVTGCYFDDRHSFAGAANNLYWPGVCILDNVSDGSYDLRLISLKNLRKRYG